ncbi:MAG TPA: glycoside hydrolase family 44 protein, partial [Candidatus Acidoferrum sp.]|nr:glycoside hydrolase family 44 protein [Candidatus Acidoferrum sp.]
VTLTSPTDGSTYTAPASIPLAANVVSNGQTITKVQFYSNGTNLVDEDASPPYIFTWTNVSLGYYSLSARVIYGSGGTVDSSAADVTVIGNTAVTIAVDAQQNRHPISPLIYGVAFASANELTDGNFTMNRSGGNEETTYNWLANAHGKGADWYFESYPDDSATPAASADSFVADSKNGGAHPMITVSMIGWMPKLGTNRSILWSYSTNKYGPQTASDPYRTDAGSGLSSTNGGKPITWNTATDANFPTNSTFEQAYVQHLINNWGTSTNGGVGYYLMDNEETIWFSTHQDIHPVGPTMQEIRTNIITYASLVKSLDPNALVCAPEEWGWSGYFYSGYDQQNPGNHDRNANGGWDYCPWLLNQLSQYAATNHQRLLDYFTLHCYPQGGEGGSDVSPSTQLLRNRSTRQLWDTNYVDESWIGEQPANNILMLIPRMKGWVASYYPGTKIGITEYNWGAEGNIGGATAQADVLGIFGREGLDLATRWEAVATTDPVHKAMRMYRNYDGNKSTFGDTSISASGPDPDNVSTFAALRSSDGALTLMVINKQLTASATASISLANFTPAGTAQAWQLTSANAITRLSDIHFSGTTFTSTVPLQSITLFVLPAAAVAGPAVNPSPANGATGIATNASLSWTAGTNATAHLLFFGVNSNAVAGATTNSPEFEGTLSTPAFSPGPLASSGRFYWRVDELATAGATAGAVWTFATVVDMGAAFPVSGALGTNLMFGISFLSRLGQTYRVQWTASLTPPSWQTVADDVPGTGSSILVQDTDTPGPGQRFYRVVILPP